MLTRRGFVRDSTTLAAAAGVAALTGTSQGLARVLQGGDLSAQRRRTYKALLETLAASPGTELDLARANAVTARFARGFRDHSRVERANINVSLDSLDAGRPGSFASAKPTARLELLRRRLRETRAPAGEMAPGYLAHSAVRLAAGAFYSNDDVISPFGV